VLGPGKFLAAEQAVVFSTNPETVRRRGRAHVASYLRADAYPNNWKRLGFTDDDFTDGGSDRLVSALVAGGGTGTIQQRVKEHLDAGADHVCLQALSDESFGFPREQWRELAPALLEC
jgi:probable F420-dependent oxidoreductase